MKFIHRTFLVAAFLLLTKLVSAQVPELIKKEEFRKDAQAAVDSLYNFNPAGADKRLASWKDHYPRHPLWQLMEGMEFWWILLSDLNDTSRDEYFFKMMARADYAASELLYNQPGHADGLIIKTVANGYIARQHSNRDEWVTSLNAARKAYKSYGYLQDASFNLADLKLAKGLKLYYSEYLPKAYPVVKSVSWFLPEGDKKAGLQFLEEAAETAVFARGEAAYFLGNINYNYEKNYDEAAGYFQSLYNNYPNNNYYARLLVKNYYKMGRYDDAMTVVEDALERWKTKELPFQKVVEESMNFWKGRILYRDRDYERALPLFKKSHAISRSLPAAKQRDYYIAAAYYAGQCHKLLGDDKRAIAYYKKVLNAKAGDEYKKLSRGFIEKLRK